jgi:DMSO reductase anchor subunit
VNATTIAWTITIFFGCSIAFAAIRKLTEDAGRGVTLLAQVAVLGLIVGVIVYVVRRNEGE